MNIIAGHHRANLEYPPRFLGHIQIQHSPTVKNKIPQAKFMAPKIRNGTDNSTSDLGMLAFGFLFVFFIVLRNNLVMLDSMYCLHFEIGNYNVEDLVEIVACLMPILHYYLFLLLLTGFYFLLHLWNKEIYRLKQETTQQTRTS